MTGQTEPRVFGQQADSEAAVDDVRVSLETSEFFGSLHPLLSRAVLYLILAFVIVSTIWATVGEIDVVATAPFRLVPLGRINTVQAPRGGEIETIEVREGEQVEQGQVMFRLSSRETWAELRELEEAKVQLEKADYDLKVALPRRQELLRETISALSTRRTTIDKMQHAYHQALDDLRGDDTTENDGRVQHEESDLEAEIRFRSAELDHLKSRYLESRTLFKKQLISRSAFDEARVQYFGALADLPSRMGQIHQLDLTLVDVDRRLLETRLELDQDPIRAGHTYKSARLRYERARSAVDRALVEDMDLILCPDSGTVTQVLVNTEGQVVARGEALATIAPSAAPMVAEVSILNKDVGLVRPGHAVRLKYDAFPYAQYGIKRGRLTRIPPDASVDPSVGPVYLSVAELMDRTVTVRGEKKRLMYGMKGIAEIVTDRQSILSMVFQPLREIHRSAVFEGSGGDL